MNHYMYPSNAKEAIVSYFIIMFSCKMNNSDFMIWHRLNPGGIPRHFRQIFRPGQTNGGGADLIHKFLGKFKFKI